MSERELTPKGSWRVRRNRHRRFTKPYLAVVGRVSSDKPTYTQYATWRFTLFGWTLERRTREYLNDEANLLSRQLQVAWLDLMAKQSRSS